MQLVMLFTHGRGKALLTYHLVERDYAWLSYSEVGHKFSYFDRRLCIELIRPTPLYYKKQLNVLRRRGSRFGVVRT